MGPRGYFSAVKQPGCEDDHSPPSSADVKNGWSCAFTHDFMAWGLVKHSDEFIFIYYLSSSEIIFALNVREYEDK
jgi:hypothetical protein